MDLERFPSGKFDTNQLVLHCALLAYNCLRLIGQTANESPSIPLRKPAQRRRLKTVIQNLIYLASRLVYHARRYKLSFGKWSPWFRSYRYVYRRLQCWRSLWLVLYIRGAIWLTVKSNDLPVLCCLCRWRYREIMWNMRVFKIQTGVVYMLCRFLRLDLQVFERRR